MTTKCIVEHLEENWANENYLAPISVISSPDRDSAEIEESTGTAPALPLVDSEIRILDFDKITRALYPKDHPTSADGIFLTRNSKGKINKLYLVEFKGGFFNKTPKETAEYKKRRKSETDQLLDSIKSKAVHSYVTLEKQMLTRCADSSHRINLYFMVVIDSSGDDAYNESGTVDSVKSALKQFNLKKDGEGNDYYYNEIMVKTANSFKKFLKANEIVQYPLEPPHNL